MIRDMLVQERLLAALSSGFGVLAAVLTVVGLYGLVAYSVARRSTEIGVRMALGATRRNILRLVLREVGVLLAIGAAAGCLLALSAGRAAASLLFRVTPHAIRPRSPAPSPRWRSSRCWPATFPRGGRRASSRSTRSGRMVAASRGERHRRGSSLSRFWPATSWRAARRVSILSSRSAASRSTADNRLTDGGDLGK